ncbi:hypothetical protein [Amycolatopsis sp. SID8362]|uniref:hypothetical protein n=1 Tax=Amycolatopsis sp. SID8362 TaxID=2690346 RepID=UPI00136C2775|nr:hypothetical protein [Amycolatopsis sp. SID8362]NBH07602.1 hypothetical protein [Amycolatopsis sp. SID8362]NED44298.1 hypothetical protein [Amycolatopsis sp. SID8362]
MSGLSSGDYVTQQIRALAQAVRREGAGGVGTRSFQLAEHLAAEGGVHRGDIMTATATLLAMTAWCDGEAEAACRFAELAGENDEDSRELVTHLLRLEAGADQGWLPQEQVEALLEYARKARRGDLALRVRAIAGAPRGGRHRRAD